MAHKLLVTGASGQLGNLVLDQLLARGVSPGDIIAATRDVSKLASYAAKGIELRHADFDSDTETLAKSFAGADRLALISTDAVGEPGKRLNQQTNAVNAAKAAGVGHIVYTSMPNPTPDSKITFAGDHRGTEEAVKASGLAYTILRNSWYQENLFMSLPQALASGQWFTSAGQGYVSHVSRADCAAALAAALASDATDSKTYTLTGPEKLTTDEIAAIASDVLGKPLAVIHLTDEQLAGGMKAAGVPEMMIPFLIGFEANTRVGGADVLTNDVEALIGQKPRSMKAFFEASKDVFLKPAAHH
jgi:NAD(P)H dehydrogenase (quinone)